MNSAAYYVLTGLSIYLFATIVFMFRLCKLKTQYISKELSLCTLSLTERRKTIGLTGCSAKIQLMPLKIYPWFSFLVYPSLNVRQ